MLQNVNTAERSEGDIQADPSISFSLSQIYLPAEERLSSVCRTVDISTHQEAVIR